MSNVTKIDRAESDQRGLVPVSDRRENYAIMKDKARTYAMSALIPASIRGKSPEEAFANCLIAMEMANILNETPLIVMNHIYIVHGRAGFETKYKIARANKSGIFRGRIDWREKGEGDNLEVTAFAVLAETGEEVSFPVSMAMAKAEGWTSNKKYQTMPKLMLRYRSASMLISLYAPDVMLGYQTVEEHEDMLAAAGPAAPSSPLLTAADLMAQADVEQPETVDAEIIEQGRTDEEHGDQHDDLAPTWKPMVDDWFERIAKADVVGTIISIRGELKKHTDALPEAIVADVTNALDAKAAEFTAGAGK